MTKKKLQTILNGAGIQTDLTPFDWHLARRGLEDESGAGGKWDACRDIADNILITIQDNDTVKDKDYLDIQEMIQELIYNLL